MPSVPQKYRITVDCAGFSPNSIKTELKDDKKSVVVSGKEDYKASKDDWSNKEFKKTIIMVTHDPHAADKATHKLHLDKGDLV